MGILFRFVLRFDLDKFVLFLFSINFLLFSFRFRPKGQLHFTAAAPCIDTFISPKGRNLKLNNKKL
ncbi:hypothetical protein JP33_00165 [Gallibacterium anatis CCM5995]|nr:hypothetical protein JP33_00165 [Gallibacterium anatis CCM5995]